MLKSIILSFRVKYIVLFLCMLFLQLRPFAKKDSLYVYSVWGVGVGTGPEFSFKLGADVIYKRQAFSFAYQGCLLPAKEQPADFFAGITKHRVRVRSRADLFSLMYGRVWYLGSTARFIMKGGVVAGKYTYPSNFVYLPPPGGAYGGNYSYTEVSTSFFGIKLNPVLEIPTPVVGGTVGVYAYASNIAISAGIELNFLLGELKDKRK